MAVRLYDHAKAFDVVIVIAQHRLELRFEPSKLCH